MSTILDTNLNLASINASLNGTGQNDWTPTGWGSGAGGAVIIWISASSPTTITGLANGVDGRLAIFMLRTGSSDVTLSGDSASSSAANRFRGIGTSITLSLTGRLGALFMYEGFESRWVRYNLG